MRLFTPLAAAALMALTPGSVLAGGPSCPVTETCKHSNDNCEPADGMLSMRLLPDGKVEVTLNDNPPLTSTVLQMNGQTILIFWDGKTEHQLRLAADGVFNYLVSVPDPSAPKGKDQTLYRGQCVEG